MPPPPSWRLGGSFLLIDSLSAAMSVLLVYVQSQAKPSAIVCRDGAVG